MTVSTPNEAERIQLMAAAQKLHDEMRANPAGSVSVDEAVSPFEEQLISMGLMNPCDIIMDIEADDIVSPDNPEARHDILVLTTENDRILQVTVQTGYFLVVQS